MSFGPKQTYAGAPLYHRPIASASAARSPAPQYAQAALALAAGGAGPGAGAGAALFATDGRGHFAAPAAMQRAAAQMQAGGGRPVRGGSASTISREAMMQQQQQQHDFAPSVSSAYASGRGESSGRTQQQQPPVQSQWGMPQDHSGDFLTTAQAMQAQGMPAWQHYRGPVAAVHSKGFAGGRAAAAAAARPQSSFATMRPAAAAQQQSYNIISGGALPVSPAQALYGSGRNGSGGESSSGRGWNEAPPRRPLVVDGTHGAPSRVFPVTMDADSILAQAASPAPQRGRVGSAQQRSVSVDRGASRSSGRSVSSLYGAPSPSFASTIHSPYEQQQTAGPTRFNPAATQPLFGSYVVPSSAAASRNGSQSFGATVPASSLSLSLASTQPLSASGYSSTPLSPAGAGARPDTASSLSSDDGHSFLEVGVAEDPNPRFRPTMEDAHVVRLGEHWEREDAAQLGATQRGGTGTQWGAGGKSTRRAFSSSMDLSSSSRKPLASPSSSSSSSHSHHGPQKVKSGYFAVYDGHGGRDAVDYIERNLHKRLARQLQTGAPPQAALEAAFLETDAAMQGARGCQDSGSTVASALLRPSVSRAGQRDLFVANVGDARAVVAVDSQGNGAAGGPLQALRLSRDHTPNDPAEAARVRRAGGAVFRGRVDGQLAVSRALGDHSLKRSGVTGQPDQQHLPLTRSHKFAIIACDGLWDVLSDHEAVNLIAGMKDANRMADKLVKTAMARGTTDNVSAMVVRLQK